MSNAKPVWQRPITYPERLTGNALKIAQGKIVNGITDADWDSYLDYCERVEMVDRITAAIYEHFNIQ